MKVGFVSYRPDSLTYTMVKAISYGNHEVFLYSLEVSDFPFNISEIPGVTVVKTPDQPPPMEVIIYQLHPHHIKNLRKNLPWANLSKSITIVSTGDKKNQYANAIKEQAIELCSFLPKLFNINRILFKDGYYFLDLYRVLLKKRHVIGFDVHSQFLNDAKLFEYVFSFDWSEEKSRPMLVNFLGSRDPSIRARTLDSIKDIFENSVASNAAESSGCSKKKKMFWHEYSDNRPAGLDAKDFVDILSQSDFSLCPPGYSLITHRPIEALVRGSIPILNNEELVLYDLNLQDGVNCIAVKDNDWIGALERIQSIPEQEIMRMRKNIKRMEMRYLNFDASASLIRKRIGVI